MADGEHPDPPPESSGADAPDTAEPQSPQAQSESKPDTAEPPSSPEKPSSAETPSAAKTPSSPSPAEAAPSPPRRRSPLLRFFGGIFKLIFIVLLVVLITAAVFIGIAAFDRRPPTDALPDGFDAYLRVESAGELLVSTLDLEVADIILAAPRMSAFRPALAALRRQEIIQNPIFSYLAGIQVHAALFDDDYLLIGKLGIRSAALRIASPFFGLINRLDVPGLRYVSEGPLSHFRVEAGESVFYAVVRGNLLLGSTDFALLSRSALENASEDRDQELSEALERRSEGDLRVLVNPDAFLGGMAGGDEGLSRMLALLSFSDYAAVDVSVTNDSFILNAVIPVSSDDPALAAMIEKRSGVPAIFSVLPEDVEYASIISAGTLKELSAVAERPAGPEYTSALEQANRGAKLALGMDLDELLFSWSGGEMGLFALSSHPEPVFFIRVADERRREAVFEDVLSSLVLKGSDDTVVDGVRLTQISFPWYIRSLLESLDVQLPEPYFGVSDGFLFLSVSAEAAARTVGSVESRALLVGTDKWEKSGGRVPASAAFSIIYSLDRGVPFFLRAQGAGADALRLYRQGAATLRFDGGSLKISLAAAASGGAGVLPMPGFPVKAEGRIASGTHVLGEPGAGAGDLVYWIEGSDTLVEYSISSGRRLTAGLDDEAWAAAGRGVIWAVSKRGSIYAFNPGLEALPGFPIATPYRPSAEPMVLQGALNDTLVLPERESRTLVLIDTSGERSEIPVVFDDPLLSPPSYRDGLWAAYPKGFLAALHLFDSEGAARPGWPVPVDQIAYGSPIFIASDNAGGAAGAAGGDFGIAFLTQAGTLTFYQSDGSPRLEVNLDGVFYSNPVWAPSTGALYALSESGTLFKITPDGDVDRIDISGIKARDGRLSAANIIGDAAEEVFVSEAGAAVYGFTENLFPLEGFPVSGGRYPSFTDINGDGRTDMLSAGFDKTIRAYSFR